MVYGNYAAPRNGMGDLFLLLPILSVCIFREVFQETSGYETLHVMKHYGL